jgi:hypothetical protein
MPSSIRPNRLPLWLKVGLAVVLVLTFRMSSASAGIIDPSTLQIGSSTDGPTGPYSPTGPGNEVVELGSSSFYVWQNQGRSGKGAAGTLELSMTSPPTSPMSPGLLVLLGIPNNDTTFLGTITSKNGEIAGKDFFGGTWNTTTGFAGLLSSSTDNQSKDAYAIAGLPTVQFGAASESWVNWSGFDDSVNGFNSTTLTNFGIYVYEIDATVKAKTSVGVTFSSLPQGTFVVAFGEDSSQAYGTPFTTSGGTTVTPNGGGGGGGGVVPAPPSVVLLGFGGFGLAFILVRSRRRLAAA